MVVFVPSWSPRVLLRISLVLMRNKMGDRGDPWGVPMLMWMACDVGQLNLYKVSWPCPQYRTQSASCGLFVLMRLQTKSKSRWSKTPSMSSADRQMLYP